MTLEITREMINALGAERLGQVDGWIKAELKERADRHKQETLAKIRQLAKSIEVGVKIEGVRGRPVGKPPKV